MDNVQTKLFPDTYVSWQQLRRKLANHEGSKKFHLTVVNPKCNTRYISCA